MPFISHSTFVGNRFFKGKHLETITPALFRKIKVNYSRERIILPDTDFIDLDWQRQEGNAKVLILFHGLEGSSQSQYIKGMSNYFVTRGWDVCAANFRSCSGEMNHLLRSYHSGATDDMHLILQHVSTVYPNTPLVAGGFSLGGNMLLKYLGEQKFPIPSALTAAFAFSVPCDLVASAAEMAKPANTIYMKRFLKSLGEKMVYKANQFEGTMDVSNMHRLKTFQDFDDRFTAPLHGFKNAVDYYSQCNSLQFLPTIQTPTLFVNALNDPFLTPTCFPKSVAEQNEYLFFEIPEYGGHVGFAEAFPNGSYWSEQRAYTFISAICN
jgi:predicted alpha/beta-fold hydrolase